MLFSFVFFGSFFRFFLFCFRLYTSLSRHEHRGKKKKKTYKKKNTPYAAFFISGLFVSDYTLRSPSNRIDKKKRKIIICVTRLEPRPNDNAYWKRFFYACTRLQFVFTHNLTRALRVNPSTIIIIIFKN